MPSVETPSRQLLLAELTIFRESQVRSLLKLSHSTLYSMMKEGNFPRPIPIGARAIGWRAKDLLRWLKEREEKNK